MVPWLEEASRLAMDCEATPAQNKYIFTLFPLLFFYISVSVSVSVPFYSLYGEIRTPSPADRHRVITRSRQRHSLDERKTNTEIAVTFGLRTPIASYFDVYLKVVKSLSLATSITIITTITRNPSQDIYIYTSSRPRMVS